MRRLVLVTALLASPPARADDDAAVDARTQKMADSLTPDARPHFLRGFKAFAAKDFATARAEFEIAYRLDVAVPLLFTWAQAERLSGNCVRAVELYRKYLYADINKDQADAARHWIEECGGTEVAKPAPPPPVVIAPPPAASSYVWYRDLPADGLAAGGLLGLAIGAVYFVKAHGTAGDADAAFYLDDHTRLRADSIHQRNVGIGATLVGGLLAGASVGLYLYHSREAVVTTDGHSVALALRF